MDIGQDRTVTVGILEENNCWSTTILLVTQICLDGLVVSELYLAQHASYSAPLTQMVEQDSGLLMEIVLAQCFV